MGVGADPSGHGGHFLTVSEASPSAEPGWVVQHQVRSLSDALGVEVTVDGPYSRQPRLLVRGEEADRGPDGGYSLRDASGSIHPASIVVDLWRLGVAVEVGGRRYLVGRTVPPAVRLALAALVVLGVLAGPSGALLSLLVGWCVLALLHHPEPRTSRDALAMTLLAVALAAVAALLAGLPAR